MSEKYPTHDYEQIPKAPESLSEKAAERHITHAEEAQERYNQSKKLEHARHSAEEKAQSTEDITKELANRNQEASHAEEVPATRELKEMAYQRLLTRARHHLSPYSRLMSHIIHQPGVDALSEVTSKTIGRPSGILGGGVAALLGTSVYYYIAKHYGYNYNSFVFLALLIIGFILGWTLELIYKSLKIFNKK